MLIFIITILVILLTLLYFKITWRTYHWKRKGVDYLEPEFLYGNIRDFAKGRVAFGDLLAKFYKHFKERGQRHGGVYLGSMPAYIPIDVEIIKNILQKDFSSFMNRGIPADEELDPLSGHLFNLENEKWRNLRTKLTPAFTSGKMKMMFPTMVSCTEGLKDILSSHAKLQETIEIKDVLGRFTTDIIGSVAFGIDCNSLKNPDSDFRTYGKKSFALVRKSMLERILNMCISRENLKKIGIKFKQTAQDVEDFFISVVKSTVNYRETNNVYRRDILNLLLQLKNTGKISDDDNIFFEKEGKSKNGQYLTINQVAAQCFVFFFAGFETSATTMTFALLELALNEEIQDKLRKEIVTVLQKYNNEITYDGIMEMPYLDKVVHETLRKHPPVPITLRKCNKDYKISNTDVTLEAGIPIMLSIQGVQMDPEYYPEPEKFDPERFSEENKAKRPPMTFLTFGDGPRICIGARFGLLQTKVGLVAILSNFKVTVNEKTKLPIEHDTNSNVTAVKGGVWLNVTKL